ncbi:MAG: ATP-dependent 6-phosphofructokinase [Eubacteriales bacterium]|nr:ATP-dependent 6-phosphofructokinase [Eubacteriales bacterium]
MGEQINNAVRRIGVLTSGGDAPGMNAAVRAVVRSAVYRGIEVVGIRRGWQGLINGDMYKMTTSDVSHIINLGGTILYTARSEEFRTPEGRKKAYNNCRLFGLDGIVAIGGDGTFAGALALSTEYPISVVGIPGTIDNDIGCTHYCIGYDTAANTAIDAIDKLRDTMQSHERCSVIEVMGHRAGNLALYTGLATGATAVLIPEEPWDIEKDVLDKIRSARLAGRTNFMIVVAEGAKQKDDGTLDNEKVGDGGAGYQVGSLIEEHLGLSPRVTVLGHVQRGGRPSARDRVTATRMGYFAVEALANGKTNRVIIHEHGAITDIDMVEGLKMKNKLNEDEKLVSKTMTGAH